VIRIQRLTPPTRYASKVRDKGGRFLNRIPRPSAQDFRKHSYWREVHKDLYIGYGGICAYCASWTPRKQSPGVDHTSIDHFIPKSVEPNLAYEWDNFRLCRSRLNQNKDDNTDVIDPLQVENGWFCLDFLTFLIKPNVESPMGIQNLVQQTIDRLLLNHNDYVNERVGVVREYSTDIITLTQVSEKYPFIAAEIRRQNFDALYKGSRRSFFLAHPS
jgi:uncharacterized protein (TIGR02646 family)